MATVFGASNGEKLGDITPDEKGHKCGAYCGHNKSAAYEALRAQRQAKRREQNFAAQPKSGEDIQDTPICCKPIQITKTPNSLASKIFQSSPDSSTDTQNPLKSSTQKNDSFIPATSDQTSRTIEKQFLQQDSKISYQTSIASHNGPALDLRSFKNADSLDAKPNDSSARKDLPNEYATPHQEISLDNKTIKTENLKNVAEIKAKKGEQHIQNHPNQENINPQKIAEPSKKQSSEEEEYQNPKRDGSNHENQKILDILDPLKLAGKTKKTRFNHSKGENPTVDAEPVVQTDDETEEEEAHDLSLVNALFQNKTKPSKKKLILIS